MDQAGVCSEICFFFCGSQKLMRASATITKLSHFVIWNLNPREKWFQKSKNIINENILCCVSAMQTPVSYSWSVNHVTINVDKQIFYTCQLLLFVSIVL